MMGTGVQLTYLRTELEQIQLCKLQNKMRLRRTRRSDRQQLISKIQELIKKLERKPSL